MAMADHPPPRLTHRRPRLTHRRPRVREVSSRFMSPLVQSKSSTIANPTGLTRSKFARNRPPPRLLQEATSDVQRRHSMSSRDESDICSTASNLESSSSCPNSPLFSPSSKLRIIPDIRSSMPDVDKWLADRNSCNNCGKCRTLNFSSSAKIGGGVLGLDSKKGKRVPNQLEDVHCLKMLSNHHLQWQFANAKAEAATRSQKQEAEKMFFSLGAKISDMRDNVSRQRELALGGIKSLTTIVEGQMPYLDEWASLQKDYSTSLLDATNALLSSSAKLPVSGNVRIDVGELGEALDSALKMVETIGSHIQRVIPKTEEIDMLVSELARLACGESALIEECGDLISKTYVLQVKECSLRSTLIQVRKSNS